MPILDLPITSTMHRLRQKKKPKPQAAQSEIGNLAGLRLRHVSDQGDEFRIRRFSLGIADGIAKKSLQSIEVTTIPGHFDGVADCSFHTAGGGLECLGDLGVQYLGDGIGVPYGPPGALRNAAGEPYKD